MKQYRFLCPYDMVQVGDIIDDKGYSASMQVVSQNRNTAQVQNGITLKVIEPSRLNGAAIVMVQYAGVIYFRNQEDAIKAVKISGESVKDLF